MMSEKMKEMAHSALEYTNRKNESKKNIEILEKGKKVTFNCFNCGCKYRSDVIACDTNNIYTKKHFWSKSVFSHVEYKLVCPECCRTNIGKLDGFEGSETRN